MWCADSWDVELLSMLPEGFILDQDLLAPLGFSIFTVTMQRQNQVSASKTVLIMILKTIIISSLMTRVLE